MIFTSIWSASWVKKQIDMKEKTLIFKALLLILTISTYSCYKNNMSEELEDIPEDIVVKGGKGIGSLELQGKSYPLNESSSYKMTSWSPPPFRYKFL